MSDDADPERTKVVALDPLIGRTLDRRYKELVAELDRELAAVPALQGVPDITDRTTTVVEDAGWLDDSIEPPPMPPTWPGLDPRKQR